LKNLVKHLKSELKLYEENLAVLESEPAEKVEKMALRIELRKNEAMTLKAAIKKLEGRKSNEK